jgi:hypothetical protein
MTSIFFRRMQRSLDREPGYHHASRHAKPELAADGADAPRSYSSPSPHARRSEITCEISRARRPAPTARALRRPTLPSAGDPARPLARRVATS